MRIWTAIMSSTGTRFIGAALSIAAYLTEDDPHVKTRCFVAFALWVVLAELSLRKTGTK